jgi:hypothetical protein
MWTEWRILVISDNYSSAGVETAIKCLKYSILWHRSGNAFCSYNVDAKLFVFYCILLHNSQQISYAASEKKRSEKYSLINGKGFFKLLIRNVTIWRKFRRPQNNLKSCVPIWIELNHLKCQIFLLKYGNLRNPLKTKFITCRIWLSNRAQTSTSIASLTEDSHSRLRLLLSRLNQQ